MYYHELENSGIPIYLQGIGAQPPPPPIIQQQPTVQPQNVAPASKVRHPHSKKPFIIMAVMVVVIAILAVFLASSGQFLLKPKTTSTLSTTIQSLRLYSVTSCENINSSGTYYLHSGVSFGKGSGACISITASNVKLVCNKNRISGQGPYVAVPPFTYGIQVINANNVSISGCQVNSFSYGIFEQSATNTTITNNNVSQNYVSNIRLQNSSFNYVANNYLSNAASDSGSLSINNNSARNLLVNNTVQFNVRYGIVVNSSRNTFRNNTIKGSPISFYCMGANGFKSNNTAYSNVCYNNTGCNFIACFGSNLQTNVANITLSKSISTCGSIRSPGSYRLLSNLSMSEFINTSEAPTPCISIKSSNINLNCGGHAIFNSTTGIVASNASYISIENCVVRDSKTGVELDNIINSNLTNINASHNSADGIKFVGSTQAYMSNVITSYNLQNGLGILQSRSIGVNKFRVLNNSFGIYLSNSVSNSFTNGVAANNSRVDVYATIDSTNSLVNSMQKSSCGVTDTLWAKCTQYISPDLQFYPLSTCTTIKRAGIYRMASNLVNIGFTCFNISQNDVVFDCHGHVIVSGTAVAPAIVSSGKRNVTVVNCSISGFSSAIQMSNIVGPSVINNTITGSLTGINVSRSTNAYIYGNKVTHSSVYGISLLNVTKSNILFNNQSAGLKSSTGIYLYNSRFNNLLNNTMNLSITGMYFGGNSQNNTVSGNIGTGDTAADYICSEQNSGINAELGGVNFGTSKVGCNWLAAISPGSMYVSCKVSIAPSTFSLSSDYVYGFGGTCFTIYSNNTQINCNGHTIIAQNGGTFVNFNSSSGAVLENCNLKGFTFPVSAIKSSVRLSNDTIYINSTAPINTVGINITKSQDAEVYNSKVISPYYGIYLNKVSFGKLIGNNVTSFMYPYTLQDSNGVSVYSNIAPYYSVAGMTLTNSASDNFQGNNFNGVYGMSCYGSSKNVTASTDLGANYCTNNFNCAWIKSSLGVCPVR